MQTAFKCYPGTKKKIPMYYTHGAFPTWRILVSAYCKSNCNFTVVVPSKRKSGINMVFMLLFGIDCTLSSSCLNRFIRFSSIIMCQSKVTLTILPLLSDLKFRKCFQIIILMNNLCSTHTFEEKKLNIQRYLFITLYL